MQRTEECQYKVLERIYFVNYEELIKKIKSGSVLRHDAVKIGASGWNEAEQFPELVTVFEEKEKQLKVPAGINLQNVLTNFQLPELDYKAIGPVERILEKSCSIHPDTRPFYVCIVCESLFCRDCPRQDGKNSLICLYCGGNCVLYMGRIWQFESKKPEATYQIEDQIIEDEEIKYEDVYSKLTFRDFLNALVYPLRFPFGLLVGGLLFCALVLGQIVTLFKGGGMIFVTLALTAVIMTLKFGILFKCFENRIQKSEKPRGYMLHVMKFGLFEDFIIPLFSGIQLYAISFGLFTILVLTAGIYGWLSYSDSVEQIQTSAVQSDQRLNSVIDGQTPDALLRQRRERETRKIMENLRLKRLETVFGTNHLADNKQLERLVLSIVSLTLWLQMPICFALILGVLFFPAVCLSIGDNQFQPMKKKFLSGLKMMKLIGFDYVKILFLSLMLILFSMLNISVLNWAFSKLEMPAAAILAAIIAGCFLVFYFWVVFSSILSTTLRHKETVPEPGS